MNPPYLTCQRHCPHYPVCKPVLDLLTAWHEGGAEHPLAMVLRDGCVMFREEVH